jgi:hypothetical protein
MLSTSPRPPLKEVAPYFFEKVLGQKLSDEPVRVVEGWMKCR